MSGAREKGRGQSLVERWLRLNSQVAELHANGASGVDALCILTEKW